MLFQTIFEEMVLLLLISAAAGVLALRLRQPPIIGFIAVGIIAGPSCLNLVKSSEQVHLLAEMGLALLLFIVGLKLDVNMLKSMGSVSLVVGSGQVLVTTLAGFLVSFALGMGAITSIYVALALTFSSTIIIVKLLSDKNEAESLHGRIAIGLLIVQDIVVVLLMVVISAFGGKAQQTPLVHSLLIALKGAGLIAGAWAISAIAVPRLLSSLARSSELLVLFGIVWALVLAAAAEILGFSKEIGAFIAGVSLASTPYREALGTKLSSLRDFLLLFFFIELGTQLDIGTMGSQIWISIVLILFVLVGKPLVMMAITGYMGYRKRTSTFAALSIAQVSEFSLIFITLGAKLGQVDNTAVGVVTFVALTTIGLSTYMTVYAQNIFEYLSRFLSLFERKEAHREDRLSTASAESGTAKTILFGLGSYGASIANQLEERGRKAVGIDFDPEAIRRCQERGMPAVFGDASDVELASALHLSGVEWVISSIRDKNVNTHIMTGLRKAGYRGLVAMAAYSNEEETQVRDLGAHLVFSPFEDAAVEAVDLILDTEEQIARQAMNQYIESMSEHYIICGYGRMGQQIVKDLNHYNVPCVVVEWNPEQLPKLKQQNIPHIDGRASEDSVLTDAGIRRAKGLIAVAPSDEENVFIVLTAKVLNPDLFVVARSILKENEDKLRHAGADMVVSPYILGGRRMAAAVIKPEVMDFLDLVVHGNGVETEMAQISVPPDSRYINKTLREINLWENSKVTLLALRRKDAELQANPDPDLVLCEEDELVIMGTPSQIAAAKELLSAR